MADEIKVTVRLPSALHEDLIEYAKSETRSLNSAMIVLLREALAGHRPYLDDRIKPRQRKRGTAIPRP